MIQFFINNIEIVLPDDFSVTHFDENALITKSGEFTLDNETSLLEPVNAKAFNHMYRLNKSTVDKDGDCRMILNGQVKNGKFVVLSNTNTSVKWQFVCGNSEVIYVTANDKKIWELDFGTETEITYERALASVTNPLWTNNFVCVPVKFSNCIANNYVVEDISANRGGIIIGVENIVMQPYLLYYVNKLPELLGFTMASNVLNSDPRAQIEFMANRVQSLKYSDALPDVTIAEFISAIEYGFNVVFNFKTENKTLEIVNTKSHIAGKKIISLKNVLDDFVREPSSEVYRFDFTKLSYDIGTSGFMKYQKLSDELMAKAGKTQHLNFTALIASLSEADKNKFELHLTTNNNRQYVFCDNPQVNVYRSLVPSTTGKIMHVNKFRSYGTDATKELTIGISPLCYDYAEKNFTFREYQGGDWDFNSPYQLPLIGSDLYILENQNVIEAIEASVQSVPRGNKIEVGLYNGLMRMYVTSDSMATSVFCDYPISFVDTLPDFWFNIQAQTSQNSASYAAYFDSWVEQVFKPKATQTMRLNDSDGVFNNYYLENTNFDTSFRYMFKSKDNPDLSSGNLFEYENQQYVPIKFERETSAKDSIVTGYFYRMLTQ